MDEIIFVEIIKCKGLDGSLKGITFEDLSPLFFVLIEIA